MTIEYSPSRAYSDTWQLARRLLCVPVALGLSAYGLMRGGADDVAPWAAAAVAGVVLWTFLEYVMHRWLYHRVALYKRYHDEHHAHPRHYPGAPPIVGSGLIVLLAYVVAGGEPTLANGLSVGMLAGYALYIVAHHACHFWRPKRGGVLYRLQIHHAIHHRHADGANYGVSTWGWDQVFGTRVTHARVAEDGEARERTPRR